VPPLAKPFQAISEMTKLPKFLTSSRAPFGPPRAPSFPQGYRATVARRPNPAAPEEKAAVEELVDPDPDAEQPPAAPDVSVEVPAENEDKPEPAHKKKPRGKAAARKQTEVAAQPPSKPTASEELDRLYQAATAGRPQTAEEPAGEEAAEEDSAPAEDDLVKLAPAAPGAATPAETGVDSENTPAAARQTDPQAAAEPPSTTIRKPDGSIVTVYHVGAEAGAPPASGAKKAEKVPGTVSAAQPQGATRRELLRSGQSGTLRKNPLR
jgi:hypothetical protein